MDGLKKNSMKDGYLPPSTAVAAESEERDPVYQERAVDVALIIRSDGTVKRVHKRIDDLQDLED